MLWYNEQDGTLQSNPPYQGWLHPEEVPILYPQWKQVQDDFVPPTIPPSKERQLQTLEDNYKSEIANITEAYLKADINGNAYLKTRLTDLYTTTVQKYISERNVIKNG